MTAVIAEFVEIANVHPRGINTNGSSNVTKLVKHRQNCRFCPNANVHPRGINTNG